MRTKDSRTVLRGLGGSNAPRLPGGLARKKQAFELGQKIPTAIDLHKELNALKATDYTWMYEGSKCAPQEALRDLDMAYKNAYRRLGEKKGKVGWPRLKEHSYLPVGAKVAQATVTERAGRWYVSVQIEREVGEMQAEHDAPIGINLGIKALSTC